MLEITRHESTVNTWRVRVRCTGMVGSFTKGEDLVENDTPPQHGERYRGSQGWHTVQSRRPTKIPPGLSRTEAFVYGKHHNCQTIPHNGTRRER